MSLQKTPHYEKLSTTRTVYCRHLILFRPSDGPSNMYRVLLQFITELGIDQKQNKKATFTFHHVTFWSSTHQIMLVSCVSVFYYLPPPQARGVVQGGGFQESGTPLKFSFSAYRVLYKRSKNHENMIGQLLYLGGNPTKRA